MKEVDRDRKESGLKLRNIREAIRARSEISNRSRNAAIIKYEITLNGSFRVTRQDRNVEFAMVREKKDTKPSSTRASR